MKEKEVNKLILSTIALVFIYILYQIGIMLFGHDAEKARVKIKEHLKNKYGEEFVVDRVGTRSSQGEEFYQARIYPESIIGTKKEGDKYYYKRASIEKLPFGKLSGVADTYSEVKMNQEAENYILPKAKEIFGNRVRLKSDVEYRRWRGEDFYVRYIVSDFQKRLQEIRDMPKKRRIELELYVYIFDRIDDDKEKEKRREEIFEFIQYLKKE
ncbi:MAG: hypothetical protein ACQERZ_06620, partial [Fusobacteriota bacterium]